MMIKKTTTKLLAKQPLKNKLHTGTPKAKIIYTSNQIICTKLTRHILNIWMPSANACQAHYWKVEADYNFKVPGQEDVNTNACGFMNK